MPGLQIFSHHHPTRRVGARTAAGTALVLGLIAIPVLPRVRRADDMAAASVDPRRQTQMARIPRWREIRREARARTQGAPDAPAPPAADSVPSAAPALADRAND